MSNITPTNIDGSYPTAGQNQSSDGFRTNFTNIRNNFTFAKDEITDLQNKALLKSALDGSELDNDLDRAVLSKAQLKNYSLSINAKGSVSGTVTVSPTDGNYVTMTLTGPATLAFDTNSANYPPSTSQAFVFIVQMTITDVAQTFTLPSTVTLGTGSVVNYNPGTRTITHSLAGTYIYEFITVNAGSQWAIIDLTNTASNVTSSSTSTIGNMLLSGHTITTTGNETLNISPSGATGYTVITGNLYVTNATRINQTYIAGSNIQALGSTANLTLDVETSSNWVVLSNKTDVQGTLNVSQSNLNVTGGTIYTRGESYSWANTITSDASISSAGFYKVDFDVDPTTPKTVTITLNPPTKDGDVVYVMVNSKGASQIANIVSSDSGTKIYRAGTHVGTISAKTEVNGTVRLIATVSEGMSKWIVSSSTGNVTYV